MVLTARAALRASPIVTSHGAPAYIKGYEVYQDE